MLDVECQQTPRPWHQAHFSQFVFSASTSWFSNRFLPCFFLPSNTHTLLGCEKTEKFSISLAARREHGIWLLCFSMLWLKTFFHKLAFQLVKSFEMGERNGEDSNRRFKFDFFENERKKTTEFNRLHLNPLALQNVYTCLWITIFFGLFKLKQLLPLVNDIQLEKSLLFRLCIYDMCWTQISNWKTVTQNMLFCKVLMILEVNTNHRCQSLHNRCFHKCRCHIEIW